MAFNINSYSRVSSSANNSIVTGQDGTAIGAPCVYTYISLQDTIATISAADYFNPLASVLNVGDLFYIVGTDANNFFTVVTVQIQPPHVTVATGVVTGDVSGPASSTNNAAARFSGATGKIIKNSVFLIDDSGNVTGGGNYGGTGATLSGLTASTALIADASKNIASSTTTSTELGYVHGVTSAIQTQFTNKITVTSAEIYSADTGAANAYVVTLSPVPAGYTTGMVVNFKASAANTGASTINVNALGAKNITKLYNTALVANDILANQIVTLIYDGTEFQMISVPGNVVQGIVPVTEGGTGVATLTTAYGLLAAGTTATGNVQTLATGNTGQVLQSNGNAALPTYSTPTYPSASGSAGQILRSDGTNNVYSTATYPNTTTANQLLYSSATNTVGGLATGNYGFVQTSSSGVPSVGQNYSNVRTINQSSHGFSAGNVLKLSGASTYALAEADSAADAEAVGIVAASIDANNFLLQFGGLVTGLSGLTAGSMHYLSPTSAGALTATKPTTAGQVVKPLLIADTTTSGYWTNMLGVVL